MYRDFSENSKNRLLNLVSQVENENISNFTDWVGDRWYDFESWIGELDIKKYLNNLNDYHKKVIDKNNATKTSITKIFDNVKSVDRSCATIFKNKKSELERWNVYIDNLNRVVNPANGNFSIEFIKGTFENSNEKISIDFFGNIKKYFAELEKAENATDLLKILLGNPNIINTGITQCNYVAPVLESILTSSDSEMDIKKGLDFLSSVNKNVGKYGKNDKITLSSSIISYISTLYGISQNSDSKSGIDTASDIVTLFKSSIGVESAVYKYYEKKLNPFELSRLNIKVGKTMTKLSILSSILGTTNEGIKSYKIFSDGESTGYDKAAQAIKLLGSIFDLGGNTYIAQQAATKGLRFVNKTSGSKKVVNQILSTKLGVKFTTSSVVTEKISKASTVLAVGDVAVSTVASGIKQYGKVTEDGELSGSDVGSVGVHGSLSGLNKVCSGLTLGVISFDSEKVATDMENSVDTFVQGDSKAANYIRNKDNPDALRFIASMGVGAGIAGKTVVEGAANCAKTVGSWVSTAWNAVNYIK